MGFTMSRRVRAMRNRRGSVYIAVMGVSMIVGLMGIAAMRLNRLERRTADNRYEVEEARLLARAGVEIGANWVNTNSNWRTFIINNTETPKGVLGNGTFCWLLYDDDGDLSDDDTDPVVLRGIGRVGTTVQVETVLLTPSGAGLDCLKSAAHAGDELMVYEFGDLMSAVGGPLSADVRLANWGTVNADVESNGQMGPGTVNGTVTGPSPLKQMPGSNVFDYYITNGTTIDYDALPVDPGTGFKSINNVLISPESNPFGTERNGQGIYILDCRGLNLIIQKGRIYGTLVLLNAGTSVSIDQDLHWEPAIANFPCLLVQGNLTLSFDHTIDIADEAAYGVNLNPTGAPYNDVTDTDLSDTYPAVIEGLVYATGTIYCAGAPKIRGTVIAGGKIETVAWSTAAVTFERQSVYFNSPPPGFSGGTMMQISPGSWQRSTY